MVKCGRFYPPYAKTAADKLTHYSTRFGCVEIDTSTYAIPRQTVVAEWIKATPANFVFHIKAYGLFASRSVPPSALPGVLVCGCNGRCSGCASVGVGVVNPPTPLASLRCSRCSPSLLSC